MTTVDWTIPNRPQAFSFLLKEDFFFLLLEDDGRIIIGSSTWGDRAVITAGWET